MSTHLEALIWEFRTALTLHRLPDAQRAHRAAREIWQTEGADKPTQFALLFDAALLAQFMGDLDTARRHGEQLSRLGFDDPLHRFWGGFYEARQSAALGQFDVAASHLQRMLGDAESHAVGPQRHAAALGELAWFHARLGLFPEALALYERAYERLMQLGSHAEWALDFLIDMARMQMHVARSIEERRSGYLDPPPDGGAHRAAVLRRRATQSLELALSLKAPGWSGSLLAASAGALHGIAGVTGDGGPVSDALLERLGGLVQAYGDNRMIDGFIWSSSELARAHLSRQQPEDALQALGEARIRLPAQGFDTFREQLDYLESMAQQTRGDHRRSLVAYQRYARRAIERRMSVPTALRDGSLTGVVRRLSGDTAPRRCSVAGVAATSLRVRPCKAGNGLLIALTARECEIAQPLCQGASNREIGAQLGLSLFTVRNHLAAVFRKLGVHNRNDARTALLAEGFGPAVPLLDTAAAA